MFNFRIAFVFSCVAFLPARSFADSPALSDCHGARAYDFANPGLGVVHGRTNERRYFIAPNDACLNPAAKIVCSKKAYVLPKDKVVIFYSADGYACVGFGSETSTSIGLLPLDSIEVTNFTLPTESNWTGVWSNKAGEIKIENGKEARLMHVSGKTTAELGNESNPPMNVHTGELDYDAVFAPGAGELMVKDKSSQGCEAKLTFLGDYLLAKDNFKCGGAEVSFNGIYRKK